MKRLDTHHGLGGMGGSLSQVFKQVEGELASAWDLRSRVSRLNHDAGLSPTHPPEGMTMRFYTGQHQFYCGIDVYHLWRKQEAFEEKMFLAS
jgi:hypothetical protein